MMLEYINYIYSNNFKKHNKISSLVYRIKDRYRFNKLIRYINKEESNYKLLLDLSNMFDMLISVYGFDKMIDILKPHVSNYVKYDFKTITKHSLSMKIDDELHQYDMEITYSTNANNRSNSVTGYYIVITNKELKISNGYSLYSNSIHKFPELDDLINITMRISLQNIITSLKKYINANQKIIKEAK